jgi:hypothetical protein
VTAHLTDCHSSCVGSGRPSFLEATPRATDATLFPLECCRVLVVPPPSRPFGELPCQCRPINIFVLRRVPNPSPVVQVHSKYLSALIGGCHHCATPLPPVSCLTLLPSLLGHQCPVAPPRRRGHALSACATLYPYVATASWNDPRRTGPALLCSRPASSTVWLGWLAGFTLWSQAACPLSAQWPKSC